MDKNQSQPGRKINCHYWGTGWDISEPACTQCLFAWKCEWLTKRSKSSSEPSQAPSEVVDAPNSSPDGNENPIEYLLNSLQGRYDREDKESDVAIASYFRKSGIVAALVVCSKVSNRIKVQTAKTKKFFEGIESTEQAESILEELSL